MARLWSVLFLAVPVVGTFVFLAAMFDWGWKDHWLPPLASREGVAIDHLFNLLLAIVGIVFVLTSVTLAWALWRYGDHKGAGRAHFRHGHNVLEVVWTLIPAVILVFIAFYQIQTWADVKLARPEIEVDGRTALLGPMAEVTGRQFEWRIRYPGPDATFGTADDLFDVNELHVPVDEQVLMTLKSEDVLHSFFLPHMRIKQDAVPGMKINVWFEPTRTGAFDIVCAELCGWGHYKMQGRLVVESRDQHDAFLRSLARRQEQRVYPPPEADDVASTATEAP